MKVLAILDENFVIRSRIKEFAHRANIGVIETTSPRQLISLLNVPNNIGLIITELDFNKEERFEVFARIKKSAGDIPVMILTSNNSRTDFLTAIRLGAVDYILKPIDGESLFKRIVDLMERNKALPESGVERTIDEGISAVTINVGQYIEKEIKVAFKGNYPVSLLISLIVDPLNNAESYADRRYQLISGAVYEKLAPHLFDTDLFLRFGSRSFIGVFPFCDQEHRELIKKKLHEAFESFKLESDEKYLILLSEFSTFPDEGTDHETLFRLVEERMAEAINTLLSSDGLNETI